MEIIALLEKIAERENICDPIIENSLDTVKGQGYLADIQDVCVKGKNKNGDNVALKVIIKSATPDEKIRDIASISQVFGREMYMYSTVFPIFYDFEKERSIADPLRCIPKCYEVSVNNQQEIIILEDLKESSCHLWDRKLLMKDGHVKLILTEYARFHAVSFAIHDQNPKLFEKLSAKFDNMYYKFLEKSGFFDTFIGMGKKAHEALKSEVDEHVVSRHEKFLASSKETFKKLLLATEKQQVVLHGDCWSNNMMFKYEDLNDPKRPTAMRLLDFQMCRIGSPVCDLVYFIYVCGSKEILDNLNIYLDIYYHQLSEHLRKLGSNSEKLFPFTTFKNLWKKYAKLGLVLASFFRYTMLSEEHELGNYSEAIESGRNICDMFNFEIANIKEYNERMRDVITHFVKNNLI